jgi:hypothetical protein
MFFHADRNVKDNLLQQYKKEAEDYISRKNEVKSKKLREEREYIDNINKKNEEEKLKIQEDKMRRINQTMGEYNSIKQEPSRLFQRSKEVRFNTYGVGSSNPLLNNQQQQPLNQKDFFQHEQDLNKNARLSPKADKVNQLFHPNQEYENYVKNQKMEQQRLYKDFLDSQVFHIF